MSDSALVTLGIFGWWGIIGFFLALRFKNPKTRKEALIQLLISGPAGWLVFSVWSFMLYIRCKDE